MLGTLCAAGAAQAYTLEPHVVGSLSVRITSHPRPASDTHAATFSWAISGIVGETRCKIDRAAYDYCPGKPARFVQIPDGTHTFTIRVRNGYRVVDTASYTWTIDTVAPDVPNVAGGSLSWRSASSTTVTASGGSDDRSGVAGYQYRTQHDGGAWTSPQPGASVALKLEGQTLVQFRTVDKAGNVSDWAPSTAMAGNTVRLDRTPPTLPTATGGSSIWQTIAGITISGSGSTDARSGIDHYEYRESLTGGAFWGQPQDGSSDLVTAEGETLVQFRAVDNVGNASAWTPASATALSTARIDRSGPSDPILTGGSLSWRSAATVTVTASGSTDVGFGLDHYEYRTSADGGTSWSAAQVGPAVTIGAEGQTLVQFRALDSAGNPSAWTPSSPSPGGTVRIDRTPPADPTVGITPPGWQNALTIAVFAGGSTDPLSGVDHYQFRSSLDAGATWTTPVNGATGVVTAEGQTLVQFRAVDGAGNLSAWAPAVGGPANTVRIDRVAPTAPSVSGGSLTWQTAASVAVVASGGSDATAGVDHYEYRTSTDAGLAWSGPTAGTTANVTAEGETLVQFRTVDTAGNVSGWAPAAGTSGGTVRIDRTAPTDPAASGGSLGWQSAASVTVSATGAGDPLAGIASYESRLSTDGGTTWTTPAPGAAAAVVAQGETLVQFRALDNAGNSSRWSPAAPTAGSTVRIDRGLPTAPVVGGGSLVWQNGGSVGADGSGGTDSLSGVAGYQYRTSADGGGTWTSSAPGATAVVSAEGETVVQFRTLDAAGNASAWAPAAPDASSTIRIDRTPPTAPGAAGGSTAWQNVPAVVITAGAGSDALSGIAGYEYRTSTDGGTSWSPAAAGTVVSPTAEGETLVQFRATDTAGNTSGWGPAPGVAGGIARIDRSAPSDPTVAGGALAWQSVAGVLVSTSGSSDQPGSGVASYQYRLSTDGGTTWSSPSPGASVPVSAQGETLVQFRSVDVAGFSSNWVPSVADQTDTVRIDRTAPTAPTVSGGSTNWQNVASVTVSGAGAADSGGSGLDHLEYRTSTDGGTTWSAAATGSAVTESQQGETLYQFRAVDGAGNTSQWTPTAGTAGGTVRIDRGPPSDPVVGGGSLAWQNGSAVAITASGATDSPGSGVAGYQYRLSTDGGLTWGPIQAGNPAVVTGTGETVVQFRAVDAAGFTSSWAPAVPDAGSTARIERTPPTAPTVTGGSTSWQNTAGVTISASGSTDSGGAGFAGYEVRSSSDGGTTWSAPRTGSSLTITTEGQTLVQFRSLDNAGNMSAWVPATAGATNTVKIDRSSPTDPATVSGGSLAWSTATSVTVSASGATDAPGSGIASYQYRTSTDGGASWGNPLIGASVAITAQTETLVQFRAVDVAGFASNWYPAAPTAGSTVRLDRTAPVAPTVSGGSSSWQNAAAATVSGTGATDGISGVAGYQVRTSTSGGTVWSTPVAGSSATVTAEGTTLVQVRSIDDAGNSSAWTPATATAGSTVKLDRTVPTDPSSITGGSFSWLTAASITVTASGSVDSPGSGVSSYQYRLSTDGGNSWANPTTGSAPKITSQGETLVQFRAVDAAGLASTWVPASPTAGSTVRLDRTIPTAPTVSGGSSSWQNVGSMTISGSGSSDTGGSGLDHYEVRTSTNNGATWGTGTTGSSVTVTSEGSQVVQVRAVDVAGNASAWTPATVGAANTIKIDRSAPSAPTALAGGSLSWQPVTSLAITASGATDVTSGVTGYQYHTSTDGGTTWGPATPGNPTTVTAEGETLLQFRSVDGAGNTSTWYPATSSPGGTARIDRTAPTAPSVSGGSLTWQSVASVTITAGGSSDSGGSLLSGYQYRISPNGGSTWGTIQMGASVSVSSEGETLVQFRSIDGAGGASAWTPASPAAGATVRLDRTAPAIPTVAGGSSTWQNASSVTVTGSGGSDSGSGIASYQYRTSIDNGTTWTSPATGTSVAVTAEAVTLVQFRTVDGMGSTSAWAPASPTAASTVRLDQTAPSAPTVSGGSSSWSSAAAVTVTASGSSDTGGSGLGAYQYRRSTDGGVTWTAPATSSSTVVSAEGVTLVQFRSSDTAGSTSAWAPASPTSASTVSLDRTGPSAPTLSGGAAAWQSVASVTVSAGGSADAGSGVAAYSYRTSTNGGTTWSAAGSGPSLTLSAAGETLVQFRATDALGNQSAWAPATAQPESTVRIDRTAPTAPGATGGGLGWQSVASVVIAGSGATDVGGSGVAAYEVRTSTDGGATWSAPASGASLIVTSEGETLVQFRASDQAGNSSAWGPNSLTPGGTVRIDRSAPSDPTVSGGPGAWTAAASVTITASGSSDSGGSGLTGYQVRASSDGGVNWGAPLAANPVAITAEGQTLVQFRGVDAAGNLSAWAPATPSSANTVLIDRTAPSLPALGGGSAVWQNVAFETVSTGGSADPQAGLDHYEYRTSGDGGAGWSPAQTGTSVTVGTEGQTLVQFRAVDALGNASAWAPTGATAASTVRIDRSTPGEPTVSGGSAAWQSVPSVGVTGSGATDALSGVAGYEYRTSTDGGTTWSTATAGASAPITAEGETLVQFRSVDGAGNPSAWAPSTALAGSIVRLDRSAPTAPAVSGGSLAWQATAPVVVTGGGSSDGGAGINGYQYRTSTDGGITWLAPQAGASASVTADGETLVQVRSLDAAGNASTWAPSAPGAGNTVRLDRTGPTAPAVTGGSLAWLSAASGSVSAGGSSDSLAGMAGYEYRTSTDAGATWSAAVPGAGVTVGAEGQTIVQFRAVDVLGNASAWAPASPAAANTVRLDRTVPGDPTVTGGSLAWQNTASMGISASGAGDALSGVDHYQYRESGDDGTSWGSAQDGSLDTVTAQGETLVQFRTVDGAGNVSAWAPAGPTAGSTALIDRAVPTAPGVTGGLLAWQNTTSVTVTAAGSADSPGSGLSDYLHRTSTDGGATWSASSPGATVDISASGQTLVQFKAIDVSGLSSPWTPSVQTAGSTVRLDRAAPNAPTVTGGSLAWQNTASITITAGGSSDSLSGFAHYDYRESADGGTTWGSPTSAPTDRVTAEGRTLVQFRAVDAADNASSWAPAAAGAANTVKIDRNAPTAPAVVGGTASWTNAASVTITGSGATDAGSGVTGYQFRTSTTGTTWSTAQAGAGATISTAGRTYVQVRALDAAGFTSAWAPASPTDDSTARIDRTKPGAPMVSGGSLTWTNQAVVTISASAGTDSGGGGVAGYEYRSSADDGVTWSAATAGAADAVTAEGTTIVQFRTVDGAGNSSAWSPTSPGAASTARIDRTPPTGASVSGGSLTCAASRTLTGSGATDSLSGVLRYESHVSADGGSTWGGTAAGASLTLSSPGSYLVQFRAVDRAGNAGDWAPAVAGPASTACIN